MATDNTRGSRRGRKNNTSGGEHVNFRFNNTMITISDAQGNAVAWCSAGAMGFKGSRKSTPYAAQVAAEEAGKKAMDHGMKTLEVNVKGPGSGRESALRALQSIGFTITSIRRLTLGFHIISSMPKAPPMTGVKSTHCLMNSTKSAIVIDLLFCLYYPT